MAKFIEERVPTEKTYVFEFTESELSMLCAVFGDLADNRGLVLDYAQDSDRVVPTAKGMEAVKSIAAAIDPFNRDFTGHDYFDWWEVLDG